MNAITAEPGLLSVLSEARKNRCSLWINDLQLRGLQFPEQRWLVEEILPAACYILLLAGPKVGKTALMLPLALMVARAGGRVAYYALDDSARRVRNRSMMAHPMSTPEHENLWFNPTWRPRTVAEAFGELAATLEKARSTGMPFDLIVIDTYGQFIGRRPSGVDLYRYDCDQGDAFKALAEEYGCTILVSHHTRKSGKVDDEDWLEQASGTNGMAGAADMIWGLYRSRNSRDGTWKTTGNDFAETELPVTLGSDMVWRPSEGLSTFRAKHSGVTRQVLDVMADGQHRTFKDLQAKTGANYNTLNSALTRLSNEGALINLEGRWAQTEHPNNRVMSVETVKPAEVDAHETSAGSSEGDSLDPWQAPTPTAGDETMVADPVPRETDVELRVPDPANRAMSQMAQLIFNTEKGSRLKPLRTLDPDIKALIPYDRVCVGGKGRQWSLKVEPPEGSILKSFDRKAAYFQGRPWLVPNKLTRRGPITWEEIRAEKWAGFFATHSSTWNHKSIANPWGTGFPVGTAVLVDRNLYARFVDLADRGYMTLPTIEWALTGKGSEVLMERWLQDCIADRKRYADNPEMLSTLKEQQSATIGSLRKIGVPGWIDRPDWNYGFPSLHYAQMNRYSEDAYNLGEQLVGVGNTDELVFVVPEGENPYTWIPESMQAHVAAGRFVPKYVMDGSTWNTGGWQKKESQATAYLENGKWIYNGEA